LASGAVSLAGDDAVLTPKSALALSLALHELATNAAKYGAFSVATGSVAVRWRVRDDLGLGLSWTESGGPPVVPPTRRGFGSSLIERALTLETGGRATVDYRLDGVVCDVVLPRSSLVELSVKPLARPEPVTIEIAQEAIPTTPRLLIVEDSYLLIMTLENMCEDLGWQVVGPATRLAEAMEIARTETFDAALLDVNLDGEMSWEVADVLTARGIPFAFSTGYDQTNMLPDHLAGCHILAKPYRLDEVERLLRQMMAANVAEVAA